LGGGGWRGRGGPVVGCGGGGWARWVCSGVGGGGGQGGGGGVGGAQSGSVERPLTGALVPTLITLPRSGRSFRPAKVVPTNPTILFSTTLAGTWGQWRWDRAAVRLLERGSDSACTVLLEACVSFIIGSRLPSAPILGGCVRKWVVRVVDRRGSPDLSSPRKSEWPLSYSLGLRKWVGVGLSPLPDVHAADDVVPKRPGGVRV